MNSASGPCLSSSITGVENILLYFNFSGSCIKKILCFKKSFLLRLCPSFGNIKIGDRTFTYDKLFIGNGMF